MAAIGIGLGLSVLGAFVLSLAHMAFAAFSKIALSGFLEEREIPGRQDILKRYEDIQIAVRILADHLPHRLAHLYGSRHAGIGAAPLCFFSSLPRSSTPSSSTRSPASSARAGKRSSSWPFSKPAASCWPCPRPSSS